jgi:hypothetical protein
MSRRDKESRVRTCRHVTLYPAKFAENEIVDLLRLEELMGITSARIKSLFSNPASRPENAIRTITITGVDPRYFSKH